MSRLPMLGMVVLTLSACDITQPEDSLQEVWTGVAVPMLPSAVAADGATDTTKVQVTHEREVLSDIVYATFTIWETDKTTCEIPWLADDDPCFYMTGGQGIGVPFYDPDGRAIKFDMPGERCELAGPISKGDFPEPDEWIAFLRCGESGQVYYTMTLREE